MHLRALAVLAGIGVATLLSAEAKDHRPKSSNSNVRRATKKTRKVKPVKYKAPKRSKKPAHAIYGAR
jgi:hypothetical protein